MEHILLTVGLMLCTVLSACSESTVASSLNRADGAIKHDSEPQNQNGIGAFRLREISSLPSRGLPGTVQVHFISERLGWLWNYNHLWRTDDGGLSWTSVYDLSSDQNLGFAAVQFTAPLVGWRLSLNQVEKTLDGGRTWAIVASTNLHNEGSYTSFHFSEDGLNGWLIGSVFRPILPAQHDQFKNYQLNASETAVSIGAVFHTSDAGLSWQRQTIETRLGESADRVAEFTPGRPWVFAGLDIYHFGRDTWNKIDYGRCAPKNKRLLETVGADGAHEPFEPDSIFFLNEAEGWLSFANAYIAKTTDGGRTWCDLAMLKDYDRGRTSQFAMIRLFFSDPGNGLGLGNSGVLYATSDGGLVWKKIVSNELIDDLTYRNGTIWAVSNEHLFAVEP